MTRYLDGSRSPMAFLGAELRRARLAAGMSQEQLGREISFCGHMVGKVETTDRPPTPAFAVGCDRVFPQMEGLFTRLLELARRWEGGPGPQWFRDWVEAERGSQEKSVGTGAFRFDGCRPPAVCASPHPSPLTDLYDDRRQAGCLAPELEAQPREHQGRHRPRSTLNVPASNARYLHRQIGRHGAAASRLVPALPPRCGRSRQGCQPAEAAHASATAMTTSTTGSLTSE